MTFVLVFLLTIAVITLALPSFPTPDFAKKEGEGE